MNCIFVSDLHGKTKRYEALFKLIQKEKPDAVFLGGDLLPNHLILNSDVKSFIDDKIFSNIKRVRKNANKNIKFFMILGNDDPRSYEHFFESADKNGLINYVHNKTVKFEKLYVSGCAYVPPTPFQLKDWERYDVSQYVDVGAISPEDGKRTIDVPEDEIKYTTIAEDLENLSKNSPPDSTIFLFHSPPYNSSLDLADLDGKMVDHAPIDIHVGSIAIQQFIEKKQPLLTLHGHVHESTRITGNWKERFGKTFSFSAVHDGPELAIIRFDINNLEKATRELISIS